MKRKEVILQFIQIELHTKIIGPDRINYYIHNILILGVLQHMILISKQNILNIHLY